MTGVAVQAFKTQVIKDWGIFHGDHKPFFSPETGRGSGGGNLSENEVFGRPLQRSNSSSRSETLRRRTLFTSPEGGGRGLSAAFAFPNVFLVVVEPCSFFFSGQSFSSSQALLDRTFTPVSTVDLSEQLPGVNDSVFCCR